MSTTSTPDRPSIECCIRTDVTPVSIEAASLESTAPDYLRELKRDLTSSNRTPAQLTVDAQFDADCSLATQEEVDRIRSYVRAGSFLGVDSVTVTVAAAANPEKVRPALAACAERAHREGIAFDLEGPITLEG